MLSTSITTESSSDFNHLSLVSLEDISLLSTNQILKRTSIRVVFERGWTKKLLLGYTVSSDFLVQFQTVSWDWLFTLHIPPEKSTIGWCWDTLITSLTNSKPVNIINWIVMRLLKDGCSEWLNNTLWVSLSNIKVSKWAVVATSNQDITILVIEG